MEEELVAATLRKTTPKVQTSMMVALATREMVTRRSCLHTSMFLGRPILSETVGEADTCLPGTCAPSHFISDSVARKENAQAFSSLLLQNKIIRPDRTGVVCAFLEELLTKQCFFMGAIRREKLRALARRLSTVDSKYVCKADRLSAQYLVLSNPDFFGADESPLPHGSHGLINIEIRYRHSEVCNLCTKYQSWCQEAGLLW